MTELPRLPRDANDDYADEIVAARLRCARAAARGSSLEHLSGEPVRAEAARGNVENFIGYAQVPVGLAGPLLLDGSAGVRRVYVPMATTEGALVASHARGMSLAGLGGGVRARVLAEGLTQNPMLVYASAQDAIAAAGVLAGLRPAFEELVAGLTRHGRLVDVRPTVCGRRLIVSLVFTTGDAIGINMAAHAAELCSRRLAAETDALERYVHGQDVEKRANARALVEGRGRSVVAETTIPRAALVSKTRSTPEDLVRILESYRIGFASLGTQNWLVQSANGLAAVMLACGQDVAYLPECSTGFLDFHVTVSGDLHASAHLPALLVGTVGGGSQKGTAAECLSILGLAGDEAQGGANTLAEILAAVVLCGDLSLMAAFTSHEFVDAHERLGRNRPTPPAG